MFVPQDSDGDKSEDNLVVDVSNEVSWKLLFLEKHQGVGQSRGTRIPPPDFMSSSIS